MASANALGLLEKLYKRIVRILTNSHYRAHTIPLFGKLKSTKIEKHLYTRNCKKMYHHQIFTQVVPYPELHKLIPIIPGLSPK